MEISPKWFYEKGVYCFSGLGFLNSQLLFLSPSISGWPINESKPIVKSKEEIGNESK